MIRKLFVTALWLVDIAVFMFGAVELVQGQF